MLIRLQSGFHFRRGIPVRFRPALGKREIWHSLETLDRNLARTRACAMYGLTSQLFECISLAMSSSEETSSLNKAVETFQEALATSDLHPVQQDLFQSIVETYDSEIQALKARYKTMNAEHLLARMEDHQRVSSVLEKIGPEINALTDIIHKQENPREPRTKRRHQSRVPDRNTQSHSADNRAVFEMLRSLSSKVEGRKVSGAYCFLFPLHSDKGKSA